MPAMLVETAFISNADEERRLTDPHYQRTLARAVLDGVNTYFTRQPPPGTLFAARAKALEGTVVASAAAAATMTTGGQSLSRTRRAEYSRLSAHRSRIIQAAATRNVTCITRRWCG